MASGAQRLQHERQQASFNTEVLKRALYTDMFPFMDYDRILEIKGKLAQRPEFQRTPNEYYETRTEKLARLYKQFPVFWQFMQDEGLMDEDGYLLLKEFTNELGPYDLHFGAFIQAMMLQATQEQFAEWAPKCVSMEMIGAYAQTELGHGSNVQGLETTATYDHAAGEFILNSPTISSTKWWAGSLGLTATHAVVFGKLIFNGENYGIHSFMVPLRDRETYRPFPGVEVGDCGPKLGFSSIDNGWLRFTDYRIPRFNMLAKYAQISEDGEYSINGADLIKMVYSTMLFIRQYMVMEASRKLAMGLTIAIRFSIVRTQGYQSGSKTETTILDYQMQQQRLAILLAEVFGMHYAGKEMKRMYKICQGELAAGDSPILAEVHAIASGLKAEFTWGAAKGLEVCRQCCGGHGYTSISGLAALFNDYAPAATYEGDNTVLVQQTARFVVRNTRLEPGDAKEAAVDSKIGHLSEAFKYTSVEPMEAKLDTILSDEFILSALKIASALTAVQLKTRLRAERGNENVWTEKVQIQALDAARSFCVYSVHWDFAQSVASLQDRALQASLTALRKLYALHHLLEFSVPLFQSGFINEVHLETMNDAVEFLVTQIRPDMLGLIESFDFADNVLNSAIGGRDGRVYETLCDWANLAPQNQAGPDYVNPHFMKYVKPISKL